VTGVVENKVLFLVELTEKRKFYFFLFSLLLFAEEKDDHVHTAWKEIRHFLLATVFPPFLKHL
jgi:hypothetical protein